MIDIEQQLSGLKFSEEVKTNLDSFNDKPLKQKRLIETVKVEEDTCLVVATEPWH